MEENKIIDNQESNDMKLEDINSNDNRNKVKKNKTYDKRRIIIIIFTIILCVVITTLVIFIKINKLNKTKIDTSESDDSNIEEIGINNERPSKVEPDDLNYAINSLSDKYNENDLKIEEIVDGNIRYVQISGLKNITIQNNINDEIKSVAYDLISKNTNVHNSMYVRVCANFSNVLSIYFNKTSQDEEYRNVTDKIYVGLNYDLTTGEKITIDKLFVSSAPIGTIISNLAYKAYAGSKVDLNNVTSTTDMSNVDLSEFEEEVINIINKYNENKESINFSFSFAELDFYGENGSIGTIYLSDYKDYIAIFKRYTGKNIFVDNNIGAKDVFVFTKTINSPIDTTRRVLSYGRISDNLFVDIGTLPLESEIDYNIYKKIRDDVETKINNICNEKKEKALSNKNIGYIFQSLIFNSGKEENSQIISVRIMFDELELNKEFFDSNLNELLIETYKLSSNYPSIDGLFVGNWRANFNDNVVNRNNGVIGWYYNADDGSYLSDNEKKAELLTKSVKELDNNIYSYISNTQNKKSLVFEKNENGNITKLSPYSSFDFFNEFFTDIRASYETIDINMEYEDFNKLKNSDNYYHISFIYQEHPIYIRWDKVRENNIYIVIYDKDIESNIVYNIKLKNSGERILSDFYNRCNK